VIGCLWLDHSYKLKRLGVVGDPNGGEGTPDERERHLLEDFSRFVGRARPVLVTYNGRSFDLPVIAMRALCHGISLGWYYRERNVRYRYSEEGHLDLCDWLADHGATRSGSLDAVARLIPGVLGNPQSPLEESFIEDLLEYPQYTRPEEFRGMRVPEPLLSGDHERIKGWRREMSVKLTRERRPDLLRKAQLSLEEKKIFHAAARRLYLALLHYPVYDKNGEIVTTAVTNMDIHDIARSARSYGVRRFYVVTPVKALQKLALKIIAHWEEGYGSRYNQTRKEALALVRVNDTLDDAILDVEQDCGRKPVLVATSARPGANRTSFAQLRKMLREDSTPFLLLLGTGWGLTDAVLGQSDYILEPIEGGTDYNHLSVRSAAAIILDRLLKID